MDCREPTKDRIPGQLITFETKTAASKNNTSTTYMRHSINEVRYHPDPVLNINVSSCTWAVGEACVSRKALRSNKMYIWLVMKIPIKDLGDHPIKCWPNG